MSIEEGGGASAEEQAEAEKNLEKGKEIAMGKVNNWLSETNFFHGVPAVNFDSLVLNGVDVSRAVIAGYYPDERPLAGIHFNSGRGDPKKLAYGEAYDIFMILDPKIIKREIFEGDGEAFQKAHNSQDLRSEKEILSPEIFSGVIISANPPGDLSTSVIRGKEPFRSEWGKINKSDTEPVGTIGPKYQRLYEKWVALKMLEICHQTPERALPVYDLGGLIWPRQMSYEQVKQFVAERDKKKAEEENEFK